MSKTILFTPVGGTDPISKSNFMDGSILHICRNYRPDIVIMYLSKEMLEYHKKDNRYIYCLDKLAEKINWNYETRIAARPELTNVHEFDYFYTEFGQILSNIQKEMDETDSLLLNISSGTPQMKSGLAVLKTIDEIPCRLIQVRTPEKSRNTHEQIKDYPLEELWELNEDNNDGAENRCSEVECPTLLKIKNEEIIREHIRVYDYEAAYAVAKMMPIHETKAYIKLLQLATYRVQLNYDMVDRINKDVGYRCIPFREEQHKRECFEYALTLDLKVRRKEYADFLRGITPIVFELFKDILKNTCGISIREYTRDKETKWDYDKLQQTETGRKIDSILNDFSKEGFNYNNVYSSQLKYLIHGFCQDEKILAVVDEVRDVESNARNRAAHQITSITDEKIKELSGYNSREIMDRIIRLFKHAGVIESEKYWEAYDTMNNEIVSRMEKG